MTRSGDPEDAAWTPPPLSADPFDEPGEEAPIVEDVEPMAIPDAAMVSLAGGVPRRDGESVTPPIESARIAWIVFGVLFAAVVLVVAWWLFFRGSEVTPAASSPSTSLGQLGSTDVSAGEEPPATPEGATAFADTPVAEQTAAAVAAYATDPDTALGCIGDAFERRSTTRAEYDAMANPDVSMWPAGLAEAKAAILEQCVPLEPYYLAWFGSFEFQDEACVRVMTDHVLANWSWLRFLEDGILDPELRPQLDAQFAAFVTAGYGEKGCFAASG